MRAESVLGYLAAALLVGHAASLAVMDPGMGRSLASNAVQLAMAVLALIAALLAARRRQGPLRGMWKLVATSFFLWTVGQALFTYFRAMDQDTLTSSNIIDLPFFAFYLPLFATLFLGTGRPSRGICWPRTLDLAQLGIVLASAMFYFALFLAGEAPDRSAAWVQGVGAAYSVANAGLWGLLLFRTLYAEPGTRRAYVQLLTFFTLYAAGDTIYSQLVGAQQVAEGAWYDLLYSVPFAYGVWAAAAQPGASPGWVAEAGLEKRNAKVEYVLASLPPLAVLFLGVHISSSITQLGLTVISASFLCYMARLWSTQHEQHKALRLLHSSERRFRAMVEKSNEAVALVDSSGTILYLTEPAGSVLGMSREGREGASAFDSVHPLDLPRVKNDMMRVLQTPGATARGEYRAQHADGTWRWLECVGTNLLEDPDVGALVVNYRDVTERRQAELALRQSEEKFSKAFHCSLYPLAITRMGDGRVVDANELLLRRLHCARENAIGCNSAELGLWANPQQYQAMIEQVRREGSVLRSEVVIQPREGEQVLAQISAERIEVEGEECVLWVAQDITQRKKTEEALQRSEARFRHLFENANDVLFTLDAKGNFTSLNRKGAEISGYKCGEGERMNFEQVVAPEYRGLARRMAERAMAGEAPPPFELEFVTRAGERVWLEVSGRGLIEGESLGVQAIARDITERRTLEHQLRQSQKMEAVGLLAGGLAHDFNNLLAVILGYTDLLGDETQPGGKHEKSLQHIRRAAERAATLTRQLLAFSRKQVMQPRVLDLNTVALEMSKLLARLIGEHIVQTTRLNPKLGRVKADPAQIEQVLMNLAVNARDAMPNGGKLIIETDNVEFDSEAAWQSGMPAGKYAMLAVQDTGVGMEPEVQARIFEPFFTTKEAGKGTGLGLAMVYGIVKQSGAHIAVQSEPGQGTTFRIYLPLVLTESVAAAERAEARAGAGQIAGSETILLVEDEPSLRGLVAEYLTECGYAIVSAGSGDEALRLAESHSGPIHMLVTDVVMPGMSGPELAQKLSKTRPSLKRVYISGYNDSSLLREELLGDGVTFIHKPIRPVELAQRLRSVLDAADSDEQRASGASTLSYSTSSLN